MTYLQSIVEKLRNDAKVSKGKRRLGVREIFWRRLCFCGKAEREIVGDKQQWTVEAKGRSSVSPSGINLVGLVVVDIVSAIGGRIKVPRSGTRRRT